MELGLAIAHHLAVFALAAILAAELALVRAGMTGADLRVVGRLDMFYGLVALLVVAFGTLRVFFGGKGVDFYLASPAFWAKMAAFLLVGLISIVPTLRIFGWRRQLRADPGFSPAPEAVRSVRPYLLAEAVIFLTIPALAAMMARGTGL